MVMCYMTVLSTNSAFDLSVLNTPLLRFSRVLPGIHEEVYLQYSNKWFVGSEAGCSCSFRHLYIDSTDMGFGEPVEWYEEEPEHIQATAEFFRAVSFLVKEGAVADCVDAWQEGQSEAVPLQATVDISLSAVGEPAFRFFENNRFNFLR